MSIVPTKVQTDITIIGLSSEVSFKNLPKEFSSFTIWFVLGRKPNALGLYCCGTNAFEFYIYVHPKSHFILPWQ